MRTRFFVTAGAAAIAAMTAVHVDGQAAANAVPPAAKRAIPRLPDGPPDLQGMYDLATLTPVERPAGTPLVMTDEQAAKLEKDVAARKSYQDAPVKADRDAVAKKLGIEATLIANRSVLAQIARAPTKLDDLLLPWQADLLRDAPSLKPA